MSLRRHTTFLGKLESALPWIGSGLVLALLLGGGAWWLLVRRPANDANRPADLKDPAILALADESRTLEQRFRRAEELGAIADPEIAGLRRALDLHQQWMRATGQRGAEPAARLAALELALATIDARAHAARSRDAERRARESFARGAREDGLAGLREALAAQQAANALPPATGVRDLSRAGVLGQEIEQLLAEPVIAERNAGLAAAARSLEARDWLRAREEFRAVRALQLRINREFPRTQHADIAALDRIDGEIESLNSADLVAASERAERQAETLRQRGEFEASAASLVEALDLQKRINREFPRGRFASSARLEALEIARQTALSQPVAEKLQALDREITAALRDGRAAEVPRRVGDALALADALLAQHPRSRLLDAGVRLKFSYLSLLGDQLPTVVEWTRDQFRPLPGATGASLERTEVPQRLYARVMNTNPSRNAGPLLPVDSVTQADAEEFCRRLTWVLGRRVRLPTEPEFRAAVAAGAGAPAGWWSAETSGQKSRATDARTEAEFSDLLGNLAEWLAPADEKAAEGLVAGGSYADDRAALAALPLVRVARSERARTIGFRVVLE